MGVAAAVADALGAAAGVEAAAVAEAFGAAAGVEAAGVAAFVVAAGLADFAVALAFGASVSLLHAAPTAAPATIRVIPICAQRFETMQRSP